MRIGIICSSSGSTFKEIYTVLDKYFPGKCHFYVLTDRECKIESFCRKKNIPNQRIEIKDNIGFSKEAAKYFKKIGKIDFILLYFTRVVSKELFKLFPVFNIHPSLLPAFKGFDPLKQARVSGVKFFGATLHQVNQAVDGGPIVAQICTPLVMTWNEKKLEKASFIQKVYLSLLAIELFLFKKRKSGGLCFTDKCNPSIQNKKLLHGVKELQKRENLKVLL